MNYSITGLDKAAILAALYNRSRPQGMGFLQAVDGDMTRDDAAALLQQTQYFDYLHGRVMKIDLSGDTLNTRKYDRDLGAGAGLMALQTVDGFSTEAPQE